MPHVDHMNKLLPTQTDRKDMKLEREHDLWRRRLSVVAGAALMAAVGSNHSISAWNAQLRTTLGYTQAQISLVCSMASFGAYFSVAPGYVYDIIGPHRSILVGGALLSLMYLSVSVGIVNPPSLMHPLLVGLAFIVVGQASNFGVFASLGPNEGLFGDKSRGKVMALQFSAFSAGGALFALVYHSCFDDDVADFFLFMASMFAAVFLFAWTTTYREAHQHSFESVPLEACQRPMDTVTNRHSRIEAQDDVTGFALLSDVRFWLLFSTVFILVGASLFIMANIAFIVESLGGPMEQVPTMVALFSVGNCLGRLIAGAVSDAVVSRVPRAYFITFASLFVACNQVTLLSISPSLLAIPIALTGLADGIMFAIFPVLTRETFGAKHFGKNFGLISGANAIGFPLFYSPIGSYFYQLSSTEVDGIEKCIGAQCFRPIFLLALGLSCLAFMASLRFAARQEYTPLS